MTKEKELYPGVRLDLKSDPEAKKGKYSNMVSISPQEGELFVDFLFVLPAVNGVAEGELVSRVILSPTQSKRLTIRLIEWVQKYEETYGAIETDFTDFEKFKKCLPA